MAVRLACYEKLIYSLVTIVKGNCLQQTLDNRTLRNGGLVYSD